MNEPEEKTAECDSPLDRLVIYRCGWCGRPCAENGDCLEFNDCKEGANDYLKEHEDDESKLVNGACCPDGY